MKLKKESNNTDSAYFGFKFKLFELYDFDKDFDQI